MQGLIGLVILILDILAIVNIWKGRGDTTHKIIWTVVILVFPIVGLLVWYFVAKK